jgi:hypothetical protein
VVDIVLRNISHMCKVMINKRQSPFFSLHEVIGGNGGVVPLILYLCTKLSGSVCFMPCSLYRRGSGRCYPFTRWLGAPQIWSLLLREEQKRKYFLLPEEKAQFVCCPACSLVTVPAERAV